MKLFPALCFLPVLSLLSCASGDKKPKTTADKKGTGWGNEMASLSAFDSWSGGMNGNGGFKQGPDGSLVTKSNKRSSFESTGESPYFKGNVAKKNYGAEEVSKKSWWGNKDFGRKSYARDTNGSRFQTTSRFQGEGAREAGNAADIPANYQTGNYATDAAREAGQSEVSRPRDAETESRRAVFSTPEEVDYRAVRSLSLEQSKGILGR